MIAMSIGRPIFDWQAALVEGRAALAAGRPDLALRKLSSVSQDADAPDEAVRLCASAMRRLGMNAAARPLLERVVQANPASAVAHHNLAAALGDLGDMVEAARAAQRALENGGKAPETWLVLGRALQGQGELVQAEAAFRQSLRSRPAQIEARRDLAQLIWMRTGDRVGAMAALDVAGAPADLQATLAAVGGAAMLDMAGDRAAYDWLAPFLATRTCFELHLAAAKAAGGFDPDLALGHAQAAFDAAPSDAEARRALVTGLMACGRVAEALPILESHLQAAPHDQYAIALRYTAWRLLCDPRALEPADYAALVQGYALAAPPSTGGLAIWMSEVGAALGRLHPFEAQPFDQSIRAGVQSPIDPRWARDPTLDDVLAALVAPVDKYVASLEGRSDPTSHRDWSGGWEMSGAWSVRLRAGGRHTDHVHPGGCVSSALHIVVPGATPGSPRAGWLRFGAAHLGAGLSLAAEHWVEPQPGRVVLFPSWMWHGTEPFTGAGERLTIAFDVQPR
jgi:tetratricopeptide (TPR) repeat protein